MRKVRLSTIGSEPGFGSTTIHQQIPPPARQTLNKKTKQIDSRTKCLWQALRIIVLATWFSPVYGTVYYVNRNHAQANDTNSGTNIDFPWKTLMLASANAYQSGDRLRISRGTTNWSNLILTDINGWAVNPVKVDAYGTGANPIINISGANNMEAAIKLINCRGITIEDIEIIGDGTKDGASITKKYGVYITTTNVTTVPRGSITLDGLYIHDIFAPTDTDSDNGAFDNYYFGRGIEVTCSPEGTLSGICITNCSISNTGEYGFHAKADATTYLIGNVTIVESTFDSTGGSAIQMGLVTNIVVSNNTLVSSGSTNDLRMFGRGSGIWTYRCKNVQIKNNSLMGARGKMDSCGAHIDIGNSNVVIESNFSYDNCGGFIEVLGNNHNCTYRYNVSVNDGWRVFNEAGAKSPGYVMTISGFTGESSTENGPFDTYIYNNTIYVNKGTKANFGIAPTTEGLLIEINIFYISATIPTDNQSRTVADAQIPDDAIATNIIFSKNPYNRIEVIPTDMPICADTLKNICDANPTIGNPLFKNAGTVYAADYTATNTTLIDANGSVLSLLPGDSGWNSSNLAVAQDILGATVSNSHPDMGAVVIP